MTVKFARFLVATALLAACSKEKVCPSDQKLCGSNCTAIMTDGANCGACGVVCATGDICSAGQCLCANGRVDCGAAAGCVDLKSDPTHCGSCATTCGPAEVCTPKLDGGSACASACAGANLANCDRACVDLATDPFHCGGCGRNCGTGEHCQSGLCLADLYLACYNTNELREATAGLEPAGIPLETDAGPVRLAWLGNALYAANSSSNTVSEVRFDLPVVRSTHDHTSLKIWSRGAWIDLEFIEPHAGLLYLSNASVGTMVVMDPATGAIVDEIALGNVPTDVPSPQGVAFVSGASSDKAYLALNGMDQVAVLDVSNVKGCQPPSQNAPACDQGGACAEGRVCVNGLCQPPPCGRVLSRIDLRPLASPDGKALPARLLRHGARLYVTLWNLDTRGAYWKPAGSGRLAVIDTGSDALDASVTSNGVAGLVDLGDDCQNPAELALEGNTLYVACGAFDYSTAKPAISGGGIVVLDLSGPVPVVKGMIPVEAGEAPGKLAFCNGVGFAADRNSGRVLRFDPASALVTHRASLCPVSAAGYAYVADLICAPDR